MTSLYCNTTLLQNSNTISITSQQPACSLRAIKVWSHKNPSRSFSSLAVPSYYIDSPFTDHFYFFQRGSGLFIGVDLIKDQAERTPATAEAEYLITRYVGQPCGSSLC